MFYSLFFIHNCLFRIFLTTYKLGISYAQQLSAAVPDNSLLYYPYYIILSSSRNDKNLTLTNSWLHGLSHGHQWLNQDNKNGQLQIEIKQ